MCVWASSPVVINAERFHWRVAILNQLIEQISSPTQRLKIDQVCWAKAWVSTPQLMVNWCFNEESKSLLAWNKLKCLKPNTTTCLHVCISICVRFVACLRSASLLCARSASCIKSQLEVFPFSSQLHITNRNFIKGRVRFRPGCVCLCQKMDVVEEEASCPFAFGSRCLCLQSQ